MVDRQTVLQVEVEGLLLELPLAQFRAMEAMPLQVVLVVQQVQLRQVEVMVDRVAEVVKQTD
jgi:hypothetical protein